MKKILVLVTIALVALATASCSTKPQKTSSSIMLINAAPSLSESELERVREFAESQLRVKVVSETESIGANLLSQAIEQTDNSRPNRGPITIVLAELAGDSEHIAIDSERGLAAINIAPLQCGDAEKYARRIERLVMRSAGTLAGLGFDPDPFCVMHSYETVEDLDRMGRNFSPPWQQKFMQAAKQMDLEPLQQERPIREK